MTLAALADPTPASRSRCRPRRRRRSKRPGCTPTRWRRSCSRRWSRARPTAPSSRKSCGSPTTVLDPLDPARTRREAARGPRRERRRLGRLSLRAHRPRPRSRQPVLRALALRRTGAGSAHAVQRLRARLHGRQSVPEPRPAGHRLRQPRRQQGHVRSARSGGELGQVAVPLRRAGQRQDRARGRHRPRVTATRCSCRTRIDVDGQTITMYDPVSHRLIGGDHDSGDSVVTNSPPRSPLGTDRPSGGRGRRRADARNAGPDVQPDRAVLRSADPDESQRRRVRRRRLRPPAHSRRATC